MLHGMAREETTWEIRYVMEKRRGQQEKYVGEFASEERQREDKGIRFFSSDIFGETQTHTKKYLCYFFPHDVI